MSDLLKEFLQTISILRSPKGCSWDRKQTHRSLVKYLDEESAEVADAILKGDDESLKEELGDLLLQIALHSEIAKERGAFAFDDVVHVINEKMIRRHPQVFSDVVYADETEQKEGWARIKSTENTRDIQTSLLDKAKLSLSGLTYANSLQIQAASVGFDWDNVDDVLSKVNEELKEVTEEISSGDQSKLEAEIGDLLFSIVNLARHYHINPESALARTNHKFRSRFNYIETALDHEFSGETLQSLDELWNKAKKELKNNE